MSSLPPAPLDGPALRRTPRPPKRSFWRTLPWSLKAGTPILALAVTVWALTRPEPVRSAGLDLSAKHEVEIETAEITVYPMAGGVNALSPAPALGVVTWTPHNPPAIDSRDYPDELMVRIDAPGCGVGYGTLTLRLPPVIPRRIELGPPGVLTANVTVEGGGPAVGARVVGLGGGPRGVPLVETVTDADGNFELEGFDATLAGLTLRITLEGYGILDQTWNFGDAEQSPLELRPTRPLRGRVVVPEEANLGDAVVYVRSLPGVQAEVDEDGRFQLNHCPPDNVLRLLVAGMPPDFTYRQVLARPGQEDVEIAVTPAGSVSGWVMLGLTDKVVGGADVFHDEGPQGNVSVTTDEEGRFTLPGVPPGTVSISAQKVLDAREDHRFVTQSGGRTVALDPGEDLTNIIIRIE